jgi:hypothetical protein
MLKHARRVVFNAQLVSIGLETWAQALAGLLILLGMSLFSVS